MAAEDLVDVTSVDGVAPQTCGVGDANVQAHTVPVDFTKGRRASVTPTTVREVIPGCLAAEFALAAGDGEGVHSGVDFLGGDAGFIVGSFEGGAATGAGG